MPLGGLRGGGLCVAGETEQARQEGARRRTACLGAIRTLPRAPHHAHPTACTGLSHACTSVCIWYVRATAPEQELADFKKKQEEFGVGGISLTGVEIEGAPPQPLPPCLNANPRLPTVLGVRR